MKNIYELHCRNSIVKMKHEKQKRKIIHSTENFKGTTCLPISSTGHSRRHSRTSSSRSLKYKHIRVQSLLMTKIPKEKYEEKRNHLQWHVLVEWLAVIADTSRWSSQTHNQTGILSKCQCYEKRKYTACSLID